MRPAVNSPVTSGFTLIELSIVLVIIGLIIGGVLVGQDLIKAAIVRGQISQIEKYQTAVNTFRSKYGYLPGDIPDPTASNFGFAARGQYAGEGDGNGVIESIANNAANDNLGFAEPGGEVGLFWEDLSNAGLIDGNFNTATAINPFPAGATGPNVALYFPQAKIGQNNYIYVWAGGYLASCCLLSDIDNKNYFGLSVVNNAEICVACISTATAVGITVSQAYNIDLKIDDGMPQTGRVTALYLSGNAGPRWAGPTGVWGGHDPTTGGPVVSGDGVSTAPSATTCYDNSSVAGANEQYSLSQNGGTGLNCALSFRFQ